MSEWEPKQAVREEIPVQIGLMGPPGGGKTWSALELATGMQRIRGGDIILIETEGKRALKLSDHFSFLRVPFNPPYTPERFLESIRAQEARKPACVIVDSLSDEHEGDPGGVLWLHDDFLNRRAGDDEAKRERMSQQAWGFAKLGRKKLINALYTYSAPLIFCFRAREKTKPMANSKGKMAPTNVGYQPIAPIEIVHALDLTCLLPAGARGVPVWKSAKATEDFHIKLPEYLLPYIKDGRRIDSAMGEGFARWMKGDVTLSGERLRQAAENAAQHGTEALLRWFNGRTKAEKAELTGDKPSWDKIKAASAEVDARPPQPDPQPAEDAGAPAAAEASTQAPGAAAGAPDPSTEEWLRQYEGDKP